MVTVDNVLGLLNEKRRRYALYYLNEQDGAVPVEEVVDAVADMETDEGSYPHPDEKWNNIELSLHHNHLQKADEYDFIHYDSEAGVVELVESPTELDIILTVANVLERTN
ncbi:hypothetical protein ACFQMM_03825 [Saliphagus sp. GCM10025308]